MTKRRIIKWLAGLGGLCVILLSAAAFLLPRILDSQAVRERIRAFLVSRTGGKVAIENIDLTWFPQPAVVARGASLSLDDKVSGTIRSIEVYPSIRGLLTGHLDISRVEVASPALSVRLPEPAEGPFNIDEIEGQIRSLLASLAAEIPGMIVRVRGGSAEIRIGDRPPVVITDLDGRLVALPGDMDVQFSSRANVFDSLRVEARINGETLAAKGQIRVENLRLRESMTSLLPDPHEYVESGGVNANLSLTSVGLKNIKAEIGGALPSLGLVRGDRTAVIEGSTFTGVISRDEGILHGVIEQLDIASPRVTAAGELTVDPASSAVRLKLVGRELDVSRVREWALKSAGDVGVVENIFRHVKAGRIPEINVQTAGRSFAELWEENDTVVTGTIRDAHIFAAALDIDLEEVSGHFVVSGGVLETKQLWSRHGKVQGRDGTLRLGLQGQNAPFHLDLTIQADAAELRSLLLRVVKDDGFRKELSRILNVEGDLLGRLVLGGRIDSLFARVSILKAVVSGSYGPIPYPISIQGGRVQYGEGRITLEDVSGAVGLSTFSGLTGALSRDESRHIEISSGNFSLDVAQTKNLLDLFFEPLREELGDVEFARGRLELASLSLKGPLDDPGRWDFSSAGTFGKIAVKHAELPAVMNVSGGRFSATPAKVTLSNVKVSLLDASLTADGSLERPAMAPLSLEGVASGSFGAEMTGWLSRQIELPERLMLRSPLQVTEGRVLLKEGGDVGFRGELIVAGGPRLPLDVVRGSKTVEVKELIVADGQQRARMTLDLKDDQLAFSFKGALEQKTLDRIFQAPPLQGSLIEGDIEVSAFVEEPLRFTARGRLAGNELWVPLKDDHAIIEFFSLDAEQDGVNVRSADLRWRNSRLSFMGKLLPETQALRLDMDISADRVVWEEISAIAEGGDNRKRNGGMLGITLPPLEGTVRLKAENFTFAGFSWIPFHATASLSPHGIRAEIERGDVCGIGTVGRVDFAGGEIGLDLSLSVTDGQLESTSRCLTENKQAVSGGYSLQAQVAGRGTPEKVAQTLRGEFDFSAQDGQFVQSATTDSPLEATFDYLNGTGDFNVAFPDLDRESFPFRLISSHGTVEGMTLVIDELAAQSSLFTITGVGEVDLEHEHIDARGLVSVRMPGDSVIRRIPIVGSILGGSILGIPVRVIGSLERPNVTYLLPSDVGAQLLRMPVRILGLPLEAIRLYTPNPLEPERK